MASSSSFNTIFSSPSPEFISLLSRRPSSLQPWRPPLTATTKPPAIFTPIIRNATVRVSAGYKKRPMDTPGAYELIDEESGERIILWGGDDDDEVSIPSKQVLSWTPTKQHNKTSSATKNVEGNEPQSVGHDNIVSPSPALRLSKGFGRLKSLKVKNIVQKVSREKQKPNENSYDEPNLNALEDSDDDDDDDDDVDDDGDDDDEIVSLGRKDVFIKNKKKLPVKSGIDELMDSQLSLKSSESKTLLTDAASNVSAINSKGWTDREPRRNFRGESRDLKANNKYNAGGEFFSRKSFKESGCLDDMVEALRAQEYVRPSHIQAMAYRPVVEGKSCIIADQSGSGKTLAYLAPLVQRLRHEETEGISKSTSKSPRAVILVPTAELASQVLRNCRSISKHGIPFRSMVATGGFRQRTQLETLEQNLDVLIATPGRFKYLIKEGFLQLTNLR